MLICGVPRLRPGRCKVVRSDTAWHIPGVVPEAAAVHSRAWSLTPHPLGMHTHTHSATQTCILPGRGSFTTEVHLIHMIKANQNKSNNSQKENKLFWV